MMPKTFDIKTLCTNIRLSRHYPIFSQISISYNTPQKSNKTV